MRRLGLVPLIAAVIALAPSARAEDAAPPTTLLGVQLALSSGATFSASQRAVDAELQRVGWPALPAVSPEFQIRFGLTALDVSLDLSFAGADLSLPGSDGAAGGLEQHRAAIGAELGYRFHLGRWLSLSPNVGVGWLRSTLCFAGHPDSTSATSRPAFEQILRNPGRDTCLQASTAGLDVGLTLAWNFRLASTEGDELSTYLSVGPRVGFGMPLSSVRTWTHSSSFNSVVALPPIQGPVAPIGGAYAGVEVQIRFGMERLSPSPKASK